MNKAIHKHPQMKLVTHNGRFHYDDVLSTAMLLRLYPDAEVIRTRDESIISKGDIVYDVGGVFDLESNRFDHHQSTFFETYNDDYSVKLSSCGLIFKYFHADLLRTYGIESKSRIFDIVTDKAYAEFFLYADAIDNGYDIYGEIKPRCIPDMVKVLNVQSHHDNHQELESKRFYKALEIVGGDLDNYMQYLKSWADGYKYVEEQVMSTEGSVLIFEGYHNTSLVLDIEKKYNKSFKFIVFPYNGVYKVLSIPKEKGSFQSKNPLKKEWRGLRDEKLSMVSGIEGCVFVHSSGFMGINKTLESALRMCKESLE